MSLDRSDDARRNILNRIRRGLGRGDTPSQAERQSLDTWMAARPRGPLNAVEGALVDVFRTRAEAMQSTTVRVADLAAVPAEAARYLAALGLPASGCVWPALAGMDWQAHGISVEARAAIDADRLGITGAYAGIAETGTLMVVSSPETPASVSLLPETHIAVIEAHRIVAHMEDAWALLRSGMGEPPRAVNFISGPSRTGDIEQTIVLGAHGPFRVHLIIVENG